MLASEQAADECSLHHALCKRPMVPKSNFSADPQICRFKVLKPLFSSCCMQDLAEYHDMYKNCLEHPHNVDATNLDIPGASRRRVRSRQRTCGQIWHQAAAAHPRQSHGTCQGLRRCPSSTARDPSLLHRLLPAPHGHILSDQIAAAEKGGCLSGAEVSSLEQQQSGCSFQSDRRSPAVMLPQWPAPPWPQPSA